MIGFIVDVEVINIEKDADTQIILGHAGFIKTTEDLYEAMVNAVPNVKFGVAFAEASGHCLVRGEGSDKALQRLAEKNMLRIGAGHTFLILFKGAYPINVANSIKLVTEVSHIYCATANALQVIVAKTKQGRSVIGVVDGAASRSIEGEKDRKERKKIVRKFGYKL